MAQGPSGAEPRFSDDRLWYWTGSAWVPAAQAPVPPPAPATPPPPPGPAYAVPQAGAAVMAIPQKKGHLGRNLAIGCGGLIALIIIISIAAAAANSGSKQPNSSSVAGAASPSATATKSQASTPTPKATPTAKATTAPAGPKVLLDKTGSGIYNTPIFTTPSEWKFEWSFDCSNFGQSGNFQVYVYDGSSQLKDVPVNALAMKGSDIAYEHNLSGPYYLEMNSECDWHVVVWG
jgi:hypothetical protein